MAEAVWGVPARSATSLAIMLALALCSCAALAQTAPSTSAPEVPATERAVATTRAATAPPFVRQEITTLSSDQIDAFSKGVALMMSRPETDPTSWLYQANIHGFPSSGGTICQPPSAPPQTAWETCQHGNFFFLSWHRMYLYYFERILRTAVQQAVGNPSYNFALPYWDYEGGSDLPEPFRVPATSGNPLYVSARASNCNVIQSGNQCVTASEGSSDEAMTRIPFCNCPSGLCAGCAPVKLPSLAFGSQFTTAPVHKGSGFGELEAQPHNVIHEVVGGETGWMAYVECAARDPIFWLHHANIDRLWQVWLNQGQGLLRHLNPLGAANWKTQEFTFFDVENGQVKQVTLTGCDILDMVTQLDYQYKDLPVNNVIQCTTSDQATPAAPAPQELRELTSHEPGVVQLGNQPVTLKLPMTAESEKRIRTLVQTGKPGRIWLVFDGLKRLHPGAYYQVYLNLPQGQMPEPKGPHFLGNISLFGADHGGHGGGEGINRSFDITDEVRELQSAGKWTDGVSVTLVRGNPEARTANSPDVYMSFNRISIVEQ